MDHRVCVLFLVLGCIDGSAAKSFDMSRQDTDMSSMSFSRPDIDHRRRGTLHQLPVLGAAGTASGGAGTGGGSAPRRQVAVRQLGSGRRQRAARPPSTSGGLTPNQIQLISLPQLDLVQRSLKILDVRVQKLHAVALEEDKVCVSRGLALRKKYRGVPSEIRTSKN